ncbi:hypothetical protein UFOVP626_6 [uncultured Caudovirales phage]|uniref:Uncharacterized protein n=1 Tax=uncultured Caudovirales phage TaxID=2100421 RepID=A0A6J7XM45_9CAUD|nr:hypothetical protein UFOVP626_6 [uncultured Caudovirales phage]CAB4172761.1 hypothetical protein UFOVP951_1 [uncultured Caudovirales phage]CAB4184707.1 hypothetical protein UFOVP1115_30 [uncultured Caudovirales phage]CAB4203891.1 hypothetical protein UFOVP1390_12 [uncultured Caudovirales phage]CAB5238354.1 hypothetical protein UFOVP1567_29 [uncultured Caudovirales phage]
MSKQLTISSVSAPGFLGLNTQDPSLEISNGFAGVAVNCVIDKFGRVGSRQGYVKLNSTNATLGANTITVIHELIQADGTLTVLFFGNGKLFKLGLATAGAVAEFNIAEYGSNGVPLAEYTQGVASLGSILELTYGGGGTAPAFNAGNWQAASLNGVAYFFQLNNDPIIYDPAVSTTTYRRVSEKSGYVGTVPSANVAISAYGRIWAANTTTNNTTVSFSDLLSGHVWSTGTSGTLDVSRVWSNGADEITGLAAHNGFLFIFGKRQILIYANATTPATMSLSDTVSSLGCIARDSIQNTGKDVVFLSNSGLRSVLRTVQEKSSPLGDLSKNIRNDFQQVVASESLSEITSVYSEKDAFYLLSCPSSDKVFCFDTKTVLEDGSYRVTTWNSLSPNSFCSRRNGDLLIGQPGFITRYTGYQDDTNSYRMEYYTNNADIGKDDLTSIIKKIKLTVVGGSNQPVSVFWAYDFTANYQSETVAIPAQVVSEYGIAQYGANATPVAQYASGISLQELIAYGNGAGKIVQTGFEVDIDGFPISFQKIEIQAKTGKLT